MAIKKPDEVAEELSFKEEKIISLDDDKKKEPDNIKVNFQDEDLAGQFASEPTKTSKTEEEINPHTSADDIQKQVLEYEKGKSSKMEYKDLLKTAEFLINLIDTAISTGLNFLAKDSAVSAYAMPAPNKKLLTEQLALILSKYQSKFSVEFLFFSGLIVLYAPMAVGAVKNRKKAKVEEKKEKIKEVLTQHKVQDSEYRKDTALSAEKVIIKKEKVETNFVDNEEIKEEIKVPFKKPGRGKGKPAKAN